MKVADDFKSIRERMQELRRSRRIDPAQCARHNFEQLSGRCVYCNLHVFHLPALQNGKDSD